MNVYVNISLCEINYCINTNINTMWPPPGSCIKVSPLMQPVAASPKGDLNTGVLLYRVIVESLKAGTGLTHLQEVTYSLSSEGQCSTVYPV